MVSMLNVDLGLPQAKQWEVTLGILRKVSIARESISIGGSRFSEEDLVSDMIGFYLARNKYGDARYSDVSWKDLAQKCGFNEDRKKARDQSADIFNKYGDPTKVHEWDSPRFSVPSGVDQYLCDEGMCSNKRSWPSEFHMVQPDTDHWSPYIPWPENFLEHSGYENIYYSGYSLVN